MPEVLKYAGRPRWWRRRHGLAVLVLPALLTSWALAIPRFQTFRAHHVRRSEIRRQFDAQIAIAAHAIATNNTGNAAEALLVAEFPVRTERHLFRRSELAEFDRRLAAHRPAMDKFRAQRRAEEARELAATLASIARQEKEAERTGQVVICYRRPLDELEMRERTVAALHARAAQVLQTGNLARALPICQQIVVLDPGHSFDDAFWANVPTPP